MFWWSKPTPIPIVYGNPLGAFSSLEQAQKAKPAEHKHVSDPNFRTEFQLKFMPKVIAFTSFEVPYLTRELVCSECRCRYVEIVELQREAESFIRAHPKAAKELGFDVKAEGKG